MRLCDSGAYDEGDSYSLVFWKREMGNQLGRVELSLSLGIPNLTCSFRSSVRAEVGDSKEEMYPGCGPAGSPELGGLFRMGSG